MKFNFDRLSLAISVREPVVSKYLRLGCTPRIADKKMGRLPGNYEFVKELYCWRDGTDPLRWSTGNVHHFSYRELRIIPHAPFHFIELAKAYASFGVVEAFARRRPALIPGVNRYFPFFWNGDQDYISLDLVLGRIAWVRLSSPDPFIPIFDSADVFVDSLITANECNNALVGVVDGEARELNFKAAEIPGLLNPAPSPPAPPR